MLTEARLPPLLERGLVTPTDQKGPPPACRRPRAGSPRTP
jgi:hypothetical protein